MQGDLRSQRGNNGRKKIYYRKENHAVRGEAHRDKELEESIKGYDEEKSFGEGKRNPECHYAE